MPGNRDPEAFGEQLLNQPPPACAERDADRDLARPHRGTREQKTRDVGARDREHQPHRHQQHHEEETDGRQTSELLQRAGGRKLLDPAEVLLAVLRRQPLSDGRHGRTSRLERLALAQPADELNGAGVEAVQIGRQASTERQVDLGGEAEAEDRSQVGWQHAEHGVRTAVEHQRAADDPRIAAEPGLPESVADHGDRRVTFGLSLHGGESAAHRHRRSQDVEEVRRRR